MHWLTLITAFGVGSVIAAVVGWWSAKAVAISSHRQNWINALRDDLATFLKKIDTLHYRIAMLSGYRGPTPTTDDVENQQEARNSAMLVYRRVLMRLNTTEPDHIALSQALRGLMFITETMASSMRIAAVMDLSRKVLKAEWEVTKFGVFTSCVRRARALRIRRSEIHRGPGVEMDLGGTRPTDVVNLISVTLVRMTDDPSPVSSEMQKEFWGITHSLQARGVRVSTRVSVQDWLNGGMINTGRITIDVIPNPTSAMATVLGAWAQARPGRKLSLEMSGSKAEARTSEEIESYLQPLISTANPIENATHDVGL